LEARRSTNTIVAPSKLNLAQGDDKFLARDPSRKEAVNNPKSAKMSDIIMKMPQSTFPRSPQLVVSPSILMAIGTSKERVPAMVARSNFETSWGKT
jgi:hypothetical protein